MIRHTRFQRMVGTLAEFGGTALKAASWKLVLGAQAVALALATARFFEHRSVDVTQMGFLLAGAGSTRSHFPDAHFVVAPLAATFLLVSALAAKEAMRRGASLNTCVLLGVGTASIATAVAQWHIRSLLGGEFAPVTDRPLLAMAVVAVDVAMLGTLFTVAYLKHDAEREILAEVRQAEWQRVELDRHRLASSIAMSRAIVDPHWLSAQIKEIRDLYGTGAPTAETRLDALIDELRLRVSPGAITKLAPGIPP
jgi:hypothetical protein